MKARELLIATLFSIAFLFLAGIFQSGGYSAHLALRDQADALMHGKLALSLSPYDLEWDYTWRYQQVHQLWGLAVPLLRIPFELLSQTVGFGPFPDRVVLFLLYFVFVLFLCRVFVGDSGPAQKEPSAMRNPGLVFYALLFPPFINLCSTRLLAYEEVSAYGYLFALGLMGLLALTIRQGRSSQFLALCALAGFTALNRPPMLIYSASAVVFGAIVARRNSVSVRSIALGIMMFLLGLLVLGVTNYLRFGGALDFGHAVAVNGYPHARYVLRFGGVFEEAELSHQLKELLSLLFFLPNESIFDRLSSFTYFGPSFVYRIRELYFSTFDWIDLLALVGAGGIALGGGRRLIRRSSLSTAQLLAIWGLVNFVILFSFYLRLYAVSTRYLFDFAPATVAVSLACALWLVGVLSRYLTRRRAEGVVLIVLLSMFVLKASGGIVLGEPGRAKSLSQSELLADMDQAKAQSACSVALPQHYHYSDLCMNAFGIPFNGSGWDCATGLTAESVLVFANSPQWVTVRAVSLADRVCPLPVEVLVGTEKLQLVAIDYDGEVATLQFRASSSFPGVQQITIGTVPRGSVGRGGYRTLISDISFQVSFAAADGKSVFN